MEIRLEDPRQPMIVELLRDHLQDMVGTSPPQSRHALDVEELRQPDITFWGMWDGAELAGCAALKELDQAHGEVKSMRTSTTHLRQGVAEQLLQHLIDAAIVRGYRRLSLETGSMEFFAPARSLYSKFGFSVVGPFGGYVEDPNSVYMSRAIGRSDERA
jgi:putative acetyltransferase